ncbi:MAG: SDR family NAD(P)-dependent oxidoreductase [Vulcanimicrobiaceae bacterium]
MTRRALVTGAAAGLAAGIAPALAASGFERVSITYRTTPPDATLVAIRAAGADADATRIDFLDDEAAIETSLETLVRTSGPFDTLVHAVGPLVVRSFNHTTAAEYREMFDGNVRSAVLCAHALLPAMRERRFGRLVFFGMNGASQTLPFRGFSLHQAAKSAVVAFARCLALEEAAFGITVNVIEPGDIRRKSIDRAQARELVGGTPRGRPGSYEDVADIVRFLVDPDRDFVTGAVIAVTGGLKDAAERNASDQ